MRPSQGAGQGFEEAPRRYLNHRAPRPAKCMAATCMQLPGQAIDDVPAQVPGSAGSRCWPRRSGARRRSMPWCRRARTGSEQKGPGTSLNEVFEQCLHRGRVLGGTFHNAQRVLSLVGIDADGAERPPSVTIRSRDRPELPPPSIARHRGTSRPAHSSASTM